MWVIAKAYLHKWVAVLHKGSCGNLFEALADIREVPSLSDQGLVVTDQSERHTEKDLRALVEKAVPDAQHSLEKVKTASCALQNLRSGSLSSPTY